MFNLGFATVVYVIH